MKTNFLREKKSLIQYFSFSIATSALGFLATLVIMRFMPPEEFGRISLFLSMQFIAVPLISFAADNLIAINKSKLNTIEYDNFRCTYVTFTYIMFSLVQLVFCLLYLLGVLHDKLFLLIPLFGLIRFLIGMASSEYVIEGKSLQYGMAAFGTTLTSLLLSILSLRLLSNIADWRIVSLLCADALFLFVRYRGRLRFLLTFSVDKIVFRDVMRFGFPLLLSVGPAWALNESDKIIIVAQFTDMASLGYYAAACSIGGIMITFNTAMLNALTPKIYQELNSDSTTLISVVKRYALKFMGAASAFACFFALVYWAASDLILPQKYVHARHIVYIVILFSLGRGLYSVLGLVADYYGMTMAKLRGVIYGGATTGTVAFLGVVKFGVIGAAIGVGSGYLVLSLFLWLALKKKAKSL